MLLSHFQKGKGICDKHAFEMWLLKNDSELKSAGQPNISPILSDKRTFYHVQLSTGSPKTSDLFLYVHIHMDMEYIWIHMEYIWISLSHTMNSSFSCERN